MCWRFLGKQLKKAVFKRIWYGEDLTCSVFIELDTNRIDLHLDDIPKPICFVKNGISNIRFN